MRQWLDPGPKHSLQLAWQDRQVALEEENSDDLQVVTQVPRSGRRW